MEKMLDREENFKITWNIKNFSLFPAHLNRKIKSPVFRILLFGNSEWYLGLNLAGDGEDWITIGCILGCISPGAFGNDITVGVQQSIPRILNLKGLVTFKPNTWRENKPVIVDTHLRDEYFPNDTLTVFCTLKCKRRPNNEEILKQEINYALTRQNIPRRLLKHMNRCRIDTIVESQTKTVLWSIKDFESLPKFQRLTFPVNFALASSPSFYVTLYKSKSFPMLQLEVRKQLDNIKRVSLKLEVEIAVPPKSHGYLDYGIFFYDSNEAWEFCFCPVGFGEEMGIEEYFKQTRGTLHLRLEFSFSIDGKFHHSEAHYTEEVIPLITYPLQPTTPEKTCMDDEFSDVVLRAEGVEIKAHKYVLAAGSEGFAAMFKQDTKENFSGVVEIKDVNPGTLKLMVAFLYSKAEGVDNLSVQDVFCLFEAADKYQVGNLMSFCTTYLAGSLTIENVIDVLKFAELHKNERLLEFVEDFIQAHSDEILTSCEWKTFMRSNGYLAASVMHRMLIRNNRSYNLYSS